MNYLAHAFLSNNEPQLIVGNFIADHLRGNDFNTLPEGIIRGIKLHRKIDTFTDSHQEFKKSKRIFYNGFEKYSGVLVDIYFDHLLAKNFKKYAHEELESFSRRIYEVYSKHQHIIPQSSSRFLEYVIKNNIYSAYGDINGIKKVLSHLSHRIRHGVQLDGSVVIFQENEDLLQEHFEIFFEELIREFTSQ